MLLSEATYDVELPTPIGIIYEEEKETYDSLMDKQIAESKLKGELQEAKLNISVIEFKDEHNDFGDIKDKSIIDKYIQNRTSIQTYPKTLTKP